MTLHAAAKVSRLKKCGVKSISVVSGIGFSVWGIHSLKMDESGKLIAVIGDEVSLVHSKSLERK